MLSAEDLVKALEKKNKSFLHADTCMLVSFVFDYISKELAKGNKVELRNFGVFYTSLYKARKVLSPETKRVYSLPDRLLPKFKPSKKLIKQDIKWRKQFTYYCFYFWCSLAISIVIL